MNYKIVKRVADAWGVTETISAEFRDREIANEILKDAYNDFKDDRRRVTSYVPYESVKVVLRDNPLFTTLFLMVEEN